MEQMARDWYDWRTRTLDEQFRSATDPTAPLTDDVPFGVGGVAKKLPPLPTAVKRRISDIAASIRERAGSKIEVPPVNVGELERYYALGQDTPPWYRGSPEAWERFFGEHANLARGFNAAYSMRATPYEQMDRSNQALRHYLESGGDPSEILKTRGLTLPARESMKMAEAWAQDPNANLARAGFSLGPQKRTDYYDVLGGAHKPVIDTWMGRVGYGLSTKLDPKTGKPISTWEAIGSGRKQQLMYDQMSEIGTEIARFRGVDPETWQGRVWIPLRQEAGYMSGNEPFAQAMERVGIQSPDYQHLIKRGLLKGMSAAKKRQVAITLGVAAGGGAALGGQGSPPD